MSERLSMIATPQSLQEYFNVSMPFSWTPQYNLPPGDSALVVYYDHETTMRVIKPMQWGYVPPWNRKPNVIPKSISARLENIQMGYFRQPLRHHRCLIPTTGFYEWRETKHGKQPYFIKSKNSSLMGLAGVWSQREVGETIEHHFAVITEVADPALSFIHERMPVIVAPGSFDTWLAHTPLENVEFFIGKSKKTEMEFWPVTPKMDNSQYAVPDCLKPVAIPLED